MRKELRDKLEKLLPNYTKEQRKAFSIFHRLVIPVKAPACSGKDNRIYCKRER